MSEQPTTPTTTPTTAPTTGATPPRAPATAATSSSEYFNSSRLRVIGLITAATVAVGALGGIAGVAFDPDPVEEGTVVQPGGGAGDGLQQGNVDLGSPGNSVAGRGRGDLGVDMGQGRTVFPGSQSTASPSPVSSATPSTGGFTESPTPSPTSTVAPPSPSPTSGGNTGGGEGVSFANGVQVYVPSGWTVDHQEDQQIYLSDGAGSFAFAFTFQADPSSASGDVITQNLDGLLPQENYTQLQTSEVIPLNPFGSVVSVSVIEYEALWVDNQGSISIHGQIYAGVRQDGTVLGVLIEHVPAEDWEASFESMAPLVDNSFNRFGGVG